LEANPQATQALLVGLVVTGLLMFGDRPSALARAASVGVGLSLACSFWIEAKRGWLNLLRADLVALVALYFLTFFEFLVPQPTFDVLVPEARLIRPGIYAGLLGFAMLAIGRHFVSPRLERWRLVEVELPPGSLLFLFWLSFALGYFHMLLAVNFNPVEMVSYFFKGRFDAPWQRGQFGDAKALLAEIGAMLYLVPPLAGVILARSKSYEKPTVVLVLFALLFTLFYGFSTGTRNIIGSYLVTFVASFTFASPKGARRRSFLVGGLALGILLVATYYGVRFREKGLGDYAKSDNDVVFGGKTMATAAEMGEPEMSVFVDNNLYVIAQLTEIFPSTVPYLGWKVPYYVLIRVIPRALWLDKPLCLDRGADYYLGESAATTIASTFIGESYMGAGWVGIALAGFAFGYLTMYWTRKAFSLQSYFGVLIYGSGFMAVAMSMRSLYELPVTLMPTLGAVVVGWFLTRNVGPGRGAAA
jgi:hypothetical protein